VALHVGYRNAAVRSLSEQKRTLPVHAQTDVNDPTATLAIPKHISSDGSPDVFQMSGLDSYTAAASRTSGKGMQRREFFGLVGGAATWPLAARAQQPGKLPVVSVLWHGTREKELSNPFYHWFREGFSEVGYRVGIDIILEDNFADESDARYNVLAPELVARRPDVLVAITAPPALALSKAHGDIPMVFVWVSDPVGLGLVDGLGKHSQNATGNSSYGRELAGKRMELLKETSPSLSRVAVLVNPKTKYETERDLAEYRKVAANFNAAVEPFDVAEFGQASDVFAKLKREGCDGVVTSVTSIFGLMIKELADAELSARIPMVANSAIYASGGVLMGYGPLIRDGFMIGAKYVKKVLAGERASNLPIEQPTRFEMAVNIKTAKAIGIELPTSILLRADNVIE
jgi:putative ABC transport system substrate-binding protein